MYSYRYVNIAYLNSTYINNQAFIEEVLLQFKKQYPQELEQLQIAVEKKEWVTVKKIAHHIKTTVCAINNQSPLYSYCERIEKGREMTEEYNPWPTIERESQKLIESRFKVIEEIDMAIKDLIPDLELK